MSLERRHIRLEGSSNLRDVGGYPAADGRVVRWGMVYRSAALSQLSEADWAWVHERGIAAVCDLRSREERELAPTAWGGIDTMRQVDEPYGAETLFAGQRQEQAGVGEMETRVYLLFARMLAPSLKLFFGALVEGHVPAIIHCAAGQDRTGLAIGLLLDALGVQHDAIFADYRLSTELRIVDNELDRSALAHLADSNLVAKFYTELLQRRGPDALKPRALVTATGEPLLTVAFRAIEQEWGSLSAYLDRELGVGVEEKARLRELLLAEPDAA